MFTARQARFVFEKLLRASAAFDEIYDRRSRLHELHLFNRTSSRDSIPLTDGGFVNVNRFFNRHQPHTAQETYFVEVMLSTVSNERISCAKLQCRKDTEASAAPQNHT